MAKRPKQLKFSDLSNPWQRFRSQTGFSQVELAAAMNVGQSAISAYESGALPSATIAQRFVALARKHRVRMDLDEVYAALAV